MNFKFSLLLLFLSVTVCEAQYDEWEFVRHLPTSDIEEFKILSENELLALDDGIIYYSDNQGVDWSLLVDLDNPIESLDVDEDGRFYYKNDGKIYQQKVNEEPIVKVGYPTMNLGLVKGDTIIAYNGAGLYYNLGGANNWEFSSYISLLGLGENFKLVNGYFYYEDYKELLAYNILTNDYHPITELDNLSIETRISFITNKNEILIDRYSFDPNLFSLKTFERSNNNGETFEEYTPLGADINIEDLNIGKIYQGANNDLLRFYGDFSTNQNLELILSKDNGYNWEIVADSLGGDFYYSPVCSHAYIKDGTKLYKTKKPVTNTVDLEEEYSPIKITPNPTAGIFKVETTATNKHRSIYIYDLNGQKIKSYEHVNADRELSLEGYPDGAYLIGIMDSNGIMHTEQIIKNKQ